jgi:hypothetical protein
MPGFAAKRHQPIKGILLTPHHSGRQTSERHERILAALEDKRCKIG